MSDAKRVWRSLVVAPALIGMLMVGCGDDDDGDGDDTPAADGSVGGGDAGGGDAGGGDAARPTGDAGDAGTPGIDGSTPGIDAGGDSGPRADGGTSPDATLIDASFHSGKAVTDQVIELAVSAAGHDGFQGVAYDSVGNIYAAGFRSEGKATTSDQEFVLAKFAADGGVDRTFGTDGVARLNIAVGGQNVESGRGIVIQPDGKIIVAGDVDHAVPAAGADAGVLARDTDIALVRFLPNGMVDTSFGTGGVVRHNLSDPVVTFVTPPDGGMPQPQLSNSDAFWSLSRTADGKLVIHARSRGDGTLPDGGARVDTDYTLVRLNADGSLDTSFGGTGKVQTDIQNTNATARSAVVLSDGTIVGTGYTRSTVLTNSSMEAQQPVIYKVKADGTPDTTFASQDRTAAPGVWHDYARTDMKNAEAYNAAPQGDKLVTVGYGPTAYSGTGSDWVLFRFNANGTQDRSFGVDGAAFLDPGGYSDNGRGLTVLADGRIIGVGGGRPRPATPPMMGEQPETDAMLAILGPDGQPDQSFAAGGYKLYQLGGQADFFHSVAVSPNGRQAAVVGVAGAASDAESNDSVLVLLGLGN